MGVSLHPLTRPCPNCGAEAGEHCVGSRGAIRKAFHRERGRRSRAEAVHEYDGRTDSPIERQLADCIVEWLAHHDAWGEVHTQVPVPPYRADILVIRRDGSKLVVECDGKAFHSTPEQVEYDKRRDRHFVLNGYAVMRFTGREITRDVRGCAAQVGAWLVRA